MKINNENEKYTPTLYFIQISTYQLIKDLPNGKQCQHNISSYGEAKDHKRSMIHDYSSRSIYSSIFDYLIE